MASTCRSCRQPIVWVVTEATAKKAAKKMPLDADPQNPVKALRVDDGNIIFTGARAGDGTWIVRYVPKKANQFRSHFATCPNRDAHRKPTRR